MTEVTTPPLGLDSPSGFTIPRPLKSCAVPMALMGFRFLSQQMFGSAVSRIPTLVPPLQDRNPADGALHELPTRRSEPRQEGVPFRAFPPRRADTFRRLALMPFLTSNPSALRTRGSRCPAASGRCSLRGSVPGSRPKSSAGRCSHGLSCLVEVLVPRLQLNRLPGSPRSQE